MLIHDPNDKFDSSPDDNHAELGDKWFVVTGYEHGSVKIGAVDGLTIDDILTIIHIAIHEIKDELEARRKKASEN